MSKKTVLPIIDRRLPSPEIHAAVLVGGRSRRFGSDKCLARLPGDDLTFLQRVVQACRQVADRTVLIGGDGPGYDGHADDVIADLVADAGPLMGLQTALRHCPAPYLLLAACDQPFLSGQVVARLASYRGKADAVVFKLDEGHVNPLPSVVNRERMLLVVEERLRAGDRSLGSAFSSAGPLQILALEPGRAELAALRDIDSVADLP